MKTLNLLKTFADKAIIEVAHYEFVDGDAVCDTFVPDIPDNLRDELEPEPQPAIVPRHILEEHIRENECDDVKWFMNYYARSLRMERILATIINQRDGRTQGFMQQCIAHDDSLSEADRIWKGVAKAIHAVAKNKRA